MTSRQPRHAGPRPRCAPAAVGLVLFLTACTAAAGRSGSPTGPPGAQAGPSPAAPTQATVERVVDGDTIRVGGGTSVRMIGVDAPESAALGRPVECFGPEASTALAGLLPLGTRLVLVADAQAADRFGRNLAYVYRLADDAFVNAQLVQEGLARAVAIEPNVAHAEELAALERRARRARAGLWGACPSATRPGEPGPVRRSGAPTLVAAGGGGRADSILGPGAAAWAQTRRPR